MPSYLTKPGGLAPIWRAIIEVGFIVFLFYSNLLMGEFSRTNGSGKTFAFAIEDIFTGTNLAMAFISGLIGYVVVEYRRKKIWFLPCNLAPARQEVWPLEHRLSRLTAVL